MDSDSKFMLLKFISFDFWSNLLFVSKIAKILNNKSNFIFRENVKAVGKHLIPN